MTNMEAMTTLSIQVGEDHPEAEHAPCSLEVVENHHDRRVEARGWLGSVAEIDVAPGEYRITGLLPSGRRVKTRARVKAGGRQQRVVLLADETTFDAELG